MSVVLRRPLGVLLAVSVLVLAVAAAAQADRDGQAPVRASRVLQQIHTEFTLLGGPWGQLRWSTGSGAYGLDLPMPSGYTCRVSVSVRSTAAKHVGRPGKRVVRVLRGEVLRFDHHGRHGGVRWWSGRDGEGDLAAAAVQRAPEAVRSARRRWIVHRIEVGFKAAPADEAICASQVRAFGPKVLRRIARTLTLADGPPPAPQPPFVDPIGVG